MADQMKFPDTARKRRVIVTVSLMIIVSVVLAPPVVLGAKTYPVSVVNGNSMVPTLQNGDVVSFRGVDPNSPIPIGTIIIFVPSNFGLSGVDYLVRPSVVHRVVGVYRQPDGVLYYITKGDNNQQNDTTLVRASNVLGVPILVVPRAGLALSFLASPQGLIAVVGVTAFVYLERSNQKSEVETRRKKLLGKLAGRVLQGRMSEELFRRFELAISYGNDLDSEVLDESVVPLADWLRKGGLKRNYAVATRHCPKCSEEAMVFGGAEDKLVVCENCISKMANRVQGSFAGYE